jgi:hypothetical protein
MIQLNAQNGQKLTLVRIVAFLVTICVSVQLYNNSTFVNSFSFGLPDCLTDLWQSERKPIEVVTKDYDETVKPIKVVEKEVVDSKPVKPVELARPSKPVEPARPSKPVKPKYPSEPREQDLLPRPVIKPSEPAEPANLAERV